MNTQYQVPSLSSLIHTNLINPSVHYGLDTISYSTWVEVPSFSMEDLRLKATLKQVWDTIQYEIDRWDTLQGDLDQLDYTPFSWFDAPRNDNNNTTVEIALDTVVQGIIDTWIDGNDEADPFLCLPKEVETPISSTVLVSTFSYHIPFLVSRITLAI